MPQGNAAFSLMPPPFYMYRMVVAKARAPEESIQDQIDKIPDDVVSPTNRYKIEVMPGIYPEAVTMKNYVDVVAPYGRVIIRPPTGTINCVTMADNSMLQGVEISLTNAGPNATGVRMVGVDHVIVEDVWVTDGEGGDIGMNVTNTGTDIIVRKCRIDEVATSFFKDGTGTLWLADCRMTAFAGGIDIDINNGTLNLMDNELMCTGAGANVDVASANTIVVNSFGNTLNGDGWEIGDNTAAWVYSHNDKFTKVTHAGAGHMVATEEPQTYRVHNGMKIGDALTAISALSEGPTDTRRFTIQVFSGEYNEAVTMARWVDLVGESNQSVVIYQATATVITAAANSRIKSVRIEITAANNNYGVLCHNVYAYLEEIVVIVTHSAGTNYAVGSTGTGGFEIHDCVLQIDNAVSFVLSVDGSGNHFVYDSELIHTAAGGYAVNVLAGDSLNSYNNKLRSQHGFYLISNATTQVLSYGDDFTTVLWSGTTGLFADLTGCRLYTCASGLTIGDWVYCDSDDHVALADSDDIAKLPSIGVIVYKRSNVTCYVKNYGYAYDANANSGHGDPWVAGTEFWIDGGANAGEINDSMPPVWQQMAGVAVSTQRFKIILGDVLGWAHTNEYLNLVEDPVLAVDDWVYIIDTANDTVAKADASDEDKMPAIGVVCEIIDATHCRVKLRGKWSQTKPANTWVASDDVYIADSTVGAYATGDITRTMPVGGIIQKVAEVKSTDGTLMLELAD